MKATLRKRLLPALLTLALALSGFTPGFPLTARAAAGSPDIGWYNAASSGFTIGTADELAGLA